MPAILDDPTAPAIYRVSGPTPYPIPDTPLPPSLVPLHLPLRDGTTSTLIPFATAGPVPNGLMTRLQTMLNAEITAGDTLATTTTMDVSKFSTYWFANFAAVMVAGELDLSAGLEGVYGQLAQMERVNGGRWEETCLGTFYVKPNYPGRSSHVCNAGFLVSEGARGKGVGRVMGETYVTWGAELGYTYSIFNLVYETNVASLRIWDALGFDRVGRVPGAGNLRSYPDRPIDAIQIGRRLGNTDKPVAGAFKEEK
ncbi:histone acetyltransferase-like protein [Elsinoe ampelina]|uniref:Histone acetyltransferase-like protein n=1 Tax=Elsinoe ampelina TaxID=302913 RepID=A0A6A6G2H9_9PEZI|nr:histone acetyltransferase-like protein [Elsinoe ampelina]